MTATLPIVTLSAWRAGVGVCVGALVAAASPLTACSRSESRPQPAEAGLKSEPCPSSELIEGVHAVLYLVEHDAAPEAVQKRLAGVKLQLSRTAVPEYWREFVGRVEKAVSLYTAGKGTARTEAELLRADLQGSSCLEEVAHQKMHRRLEGKARPDSSSAP